MAKQDFKKIIGDEYNETAFLFSRKYTTNLKIIFLSTLFENMNFHKMKFKLDHFKKELNPDKSKDDQ